MTHWSVFIRVYGYRRAKGFSMNQALKAAMRAVRAI